MNFEKMAASVQDGLIGTSEAEERVRKIIRKLAERGGSDDTACRLLEKLYSDVQRCTEESEDEARKAVYLRALEIALQISSEEIETAADNLRAILGKEYPQDELVQTARHDVITEKFYEQVGYVGSVNLEIMRYMAISKERLQGGMLESSACEREKYTRVREELKNLRDLMSDARRISPEEAKVTLSTFVKEHFRKEESVHRRLTAIPCHAEEMPMINQPQAQVRVR